MTLEQLKISYIKYTLGKCGGNKTHAAESLGVDLRSLRRWVRKNPELSEYYIEPTWDYILKPKEDSRDE